LAELPKWDGHSR